MITQHVRNALVYGTAALALAACGGSGGSAINAIWAPPVTPTPTPTAAATGTWADTSQSRAFTTLGSQVEHVAAGGTVSSIIAAVGADQVLIQYSVTQGTYLITLPSVGMGRLDHGDIIDAAGQKIAKLSFEARPTGFTYANLGSWVSGDGTNDLKIGAFAFGTPTPAGDVPVSGSAKYTGMLAAETDEAFVRPSEGFVSPQYIDGGVTMNFDFAGGKLTGQIAPILECWNCLWGEPLQVLNFTQIVYSTGSNSFSGKFDTPLSGANFFNGIFVGPHGEETMAKFQAPYQEPYSNVLHMMSGVWVAKKGN